MTRLPIVLIFIAGLALPKAVKSDTPAGKVEGLVTLLANSDTDWEQRAEAEAALAGMPVTQVLPALLQKLQPRPGGPAHPSAESAAADKDGPPEWLAYHSMRRALSTQLAKRDEPLGPILTDLLAAATTSEMRLVLSRALRADWSDRAETPLARLFRDAGERSEVRAAAADTLLRHRRDRYYDEVRAVAGGASESMKSLLFPLLAASRPTAGRGIDPVVAVMGFEVMEQRHHASDDPTAGYTAAVALEAYLGVSFRPDPANPKYKPDGELGDPFRRDTVDYAQTWWKANGPAIEAEAAKTRPGPA